MRPTYVILVWRSHTLGLDCKSLLTLTYTVRLRLFEPGYVHSSGYIPIQSNGLGKTGEEIGSGSGRSVGKIGRLAAGRSRAQISGVKKSRNTQSCSHTGHQPGHNTEQRIHITEDAAENLQSSQAFRYLTKAGSVYKGELGPTIVSGGQILLGRVFIAYSIYLHMI